MDQDEPHEANAPDIKEKLTLHVKRRISGVKDDANGKTFEVISGDDEALSLVVKKKSSKTKKKRGPKQNKRSRIKVEDIGKDDISEEHHMQCESIGPTSTVTTSGEGDEFTSTGTEDTTPPGIHTPQKESPEPSIQPKNPSECGSNRRDSLLNNSILNEVLNERKRALFESAEVLEYLRKRINNT